MPAVMNFLSAVCDGSALPASTRVPSRRRAGNRTEATPEESQASPAIVTSRDLQRRHGAHGLLLDEATVDAPLARQELMMPAVLDDTAALEHQDAVQRPHRRQPVGNDQRGA